VRYLCAVAQIRILCRIALLPASCNAASFSYWAPTVVVRSPGECARFVPMARPCHSRIGHFYLLESLQCIRTVRLFFFNDLTFGEFQSMLDVASCRETQTSRCSTVLLSIFFSLLLFEQYLRWQTYRHRRSYICHP
jgi:hypothetical protein